MEVHLAASVPGKVPLHVPLGRPFFCFLRFMRDAEEKDLSVLSSKGKFCPGKRSGE
jgi:hypothetical protein